METSQKIPLDFTEKADGEHKDPVFEEGGKYWWWDESQSVKYGPYDTYEAAQAELVRYCKECLGVDAVINTLHPPAPVEKLEPPLPSHVGELLGVTSTAIPTDDSGPGHYLHKEAFCLITYQVEGTEKTLKLWNSRDGKVPSQFKHMTTGLTYQRVVGSEVSVPDYTPGMGDLVIEHANEAGQPKIAVATTDWLNKHKKMYGNPQSTIRRLETTLRSKDVTIRDTMKERDDFALVCTERNREITAMQRERNTLAKVHEDEMRAAKDENQKLQLEIARMKEEREQLVKFKLFTAAVEDLIHDCPEIEDGDPDLKS